MELGRKGYATISSVVGSLLFVVSVSVAGPRGEPTLQICFGEHHPRCLLYTRYKSSPALSYVYRDEIRPQYKLKKVEAQEVDRLIAKFKKENADKKAIGPCRWLVSLESYIDLHLQNVEAFCSDKEKSAQLEDSLSRYRSKK